MKSMYYSPWVFVNLGPIFGIFETCEKRSVGTLEQLCEVSSEAHVLFELGSRLDNITKNSIKSMYYSPSVFVNLGPIFGIFETNPKRFLGTPEQLCVVSLEAYVSFELGSRLDNITKNQLNPCTIVIGFC